MSEKTYLIEMKKEDMIRFYANKIVEDGIRECLEFNTIININKYCETIDLKLYEEELIDQLCKDERLADVTFDNELNIDMVFYTDYCPYYYEDIEDITQKEEIEILDDFLFFSNKAVLLEGYISIRNLINKYVNKLENRSIEEKNCIKNIIKKNIVETGFIDKYIDGSNETYLKLRNSLKFEEGIKEKINKLEEEINQEEEEMEE